MYIVIDTMDGNDNIDTLDQTGDADSVVMETQTVEGNINDFVNTDSRLCANLSSENDKILDSSSLVEQGQSSVISIDCSSPSESDDKEVIFIENQSPTDDCVINSSEESVIKDGVDNEAPTKRFCSDVINQLDNVTPGSVEVNVQSLSSDSSEVSMEDNPTEDKQKSQNTLIGPVLPPHLQRKQSIDSTDSCPHISRMQLQTTSVLITKANDFSSPDNYLRGCKWAPDGTCILTNSNDNLLRLFNTPEPIYDENGILTDKPPVDSVLRISETDTIYDFCWYPKMSSAEPQTSCLVSTCKDSPVHLWDAYTGELRCSYRPYNHLDEISAAYSLCFSPDGSKIYCGFNKMIRIFDVERPGRECIARQTYKKIGQPGIISCITPSPVNDGMYAAGSYARGIALYSEPNGDMVCLFQGQQGGVTHIAFSPDGTKLYSGGRKDPEIICWDLRNPGHILFVALREVETNQRIHFELDKTGRYLMSGSHDGTVYVWDTTVAPVEVFQGSDAVLQPAFKFQAHADTVNGVSLHPDMPVLATASGQRHFPDLEDSDTSDCEINCVENSLKFWWLF